MASPFVYVASLRRTGSTLICRLLSHYPDAYILAEPQLTRGAFRPKARDVAAFRQSGLDLSDFQGRFALPRFLYEALPACQQVVQQLGIKEIHHRGWRLIARALPDVRFVVTARDPRDIYLSAAHQYVDNPAASRIAPQRISRYILREFKYQLQMLNEQRCLLLRYEDLCHHSEEQLCRLQEFIESPRRSSQQAAGSSGSQSTPEEVAAESREPIVAGSIERWKSERETDLRRDCDKVLDRTKAYCEFWGYDKTGALPHDKTSIRRSAA